MPQIETQRGTYNRIALIGKVSQSKQTQLPSGDWLSEWTISTYTEEDKIMFHNCKIIGIDPIEYKEGETANVDGELIYETYRGVTLAKIYVKDFYNPEND